MREKKGVVFWRMVLFLGLLVIIIAPTAVSAAGAEEGVIAAGRFEGVLDAHLRMRRADALVDLVRVSYPAGDGFEAGSVWVVAGVAYFNPNPGFMRQVPGTPFVYLPNGPWLSSSEIEEDLEAGTGLAVVVFPWRFDDPRARAEEYAELRRIENLFRSSNVLFWRIDVIREKVDDFKFE